MSLIESLESRSLMSASPFLAPAAPSHGVAPSGVFATLAVTIPSVVGTWSGTLALPGVHNQPVKITFSTQSSRGILTGTLRTAANSSIRVAVTGRVTSTGVVAVTLGGKHSGGPINGSGSGRLRSGNTRVTLAINFTQGGKVFPGTITLRKL